MVVHVCLLDWFLLLLFISLPWKNNSAELLKFQPMVCIHSYLDFLELSCKYICRPYYTTESLCMYHIKLLGELIYQLYCTIAGMSLGFALHPCIISLASNQWALICAWTFHFFWLYISLLSSSSPPFTSYLLVSGTLDWLLAWQAQDQEYGP